MNVRMSFDQVCLTGEKKGKCGCGVSRKRRQKFWQTLNPFNVNKKTKLQKTRGEILDELRAEIKKWEKLPIDCDKCRKP